MSPIEDFSMLSYSKINSGVLKGEMEDEIKDKVEVVKDFRVGLSRRRDGEEK